MKTLLITLLLVSSSIFAQSYVGSESFFSDSLNSRPQDLGGYHDQQLQRNEKEPDQMQQQLRDQVRHEQQMRKLKNVGGGEYENPSIYENIGGGGYKRPSIYGDNY